MIKNLVLLIFFFLKTMKGKNMDIILSQATLKTMIIIIHRILVVMKVSLFWIMVLLVTQMRATMETMMTSLHKVLMML